MPTYEYRCNACGKDFEYQQKMADPDLTKCEACGEDKLEKLISWSAFQLKGGGWYKDLYSSKKGGERSENDRIDRLSKAVSDDKAKPAAESSSAETSTSSSSSDSSTGGTSSGATSTTATTTTS